LKAGQLETCEVQLVIKEVDVIHFKLKPNKFWN